MRCALPTSAPVHHLTDDQLAEIDESFRNSRSSSPRETPAAVENDPDDDHFLAGADYGATDCLVTGDPHPLKLGSYQGIPIRSPADFLDQFFPR